MEKVLRKSGVFSNEGVMVGLQFGLTPIEHCEDERIVKKRCDKLNRSFYKNFRTLEGQCNNEENPLLGSTRSQLSRLLDADHEKFQRKTFFDKPENLGKSWLQKKLLLLQATKIITPVDLTDFKRINQVVLRVSLSRR